MIDKKVWRLFKKVPYSVLPSDSEASLTSFGTASPLTSFGTASPLTSFGVASPGRPLGLRLGATSGGLAQIFKTALEGIRLFQLNFSYIFV
jgi:hypothetical protein